MRTLLLLGLLAAAMPVPAAAQEALDGPGFEAFVLGQSYSIADPLGTAPYGVEHYFEGGRVTWRWLDTGKCEEGTWYESSDFPGGPAICFDYVGEPTTQCWRYVPKGDGLLATFLGAPDAQSAVKGYTIAPEPGATYCEWFGA